MPVSQGLKYASAQSLLLQAHALQLLKQAAQGSANHSAPGSIQPYAKEDF
jgi:hypothetical protein